MRELGAIFLLVFVAIMLIVLVAFVLSLIVIAAGRKYSRQYREQMIGKVTQVLEGNGDEELAEKYLYTGKGLPETLSEEAVEKLKKIRKEWVEEQDRIEMEYEKNRKRPKRKIINIYANPDKPNGD